MYEVSNLIEKCILALKIISYYRFNQLWRQHVHFNERCATWAQQT